MNSATASSGILQIVAADGSSSNIALSITRTPPGWGLTIVLGVSALLALLIVLWAGAQKLRRRLNSFLFDYRWPERPDPALPSLPSLGSRWSEPLAEATSWSFDSWATNISGLGAVAGATFGATGSLMTIFPGVSTTTFIVLPIVFGLLAAAAPMVFSAITTTDAALVDGHPTAVGTVGGFIVSGALTATAVLGQIASLILLMVMGGLSGTKLLGIAIVAAVTTALALWYLFVTMRSGTTSGRSYAAPGTSPIGSARIRLATFASNDPVMTALVEGSPVMAAFAAHSEKAIDDKPTSKAGIRVALL